MLTRTFKLLIRNARKYPAISVINIFGLVLGITSTLFILEYVQYERSFEAFHQNADRIYRVAYNRYQENRLLWKTANSFYPTGEFLKVTFPEVEGYFQLRRNYNIEVSCRDDEGKLRSFFEEKTYFATPSVFSILNIDLLQGTEDCLSEPNAVIISERAAGKYFGTTDPVGKEIQVNARDVFVITGIYKTFSTNSHIKTDFLFSFENIYIRDPWLKTNWFFDYNYTYLILRPGTDSKAFTKKAFPRMISENYEDYLKEVNQRDEFFLQPFHSIHLNSAIEYETEPPGNSKAIAILFGFSLFFLLIAWVNYINLSTARAIERAKEIGIKKVHGALRPKLIIQFLGEAVMLNTLCLILSLLLVFMLNPLYREVTGILDLRFPAGAGSLTFAFIIFVTGVFLSGFYPAFILSSFKPLMVLKGNFKNTVSGILFRKGMVMFQLFVSLSLLVCTGVIFDQVRFLMRKDPGFDPTSVMIVKAPRTADPDSLYKNRITVLRNEILNLPAVRSFTFISDIPGQEINNWFSCYRKGFSSNDTKDYFRTDIDENFMDFFKIKCLAGRNYGVEDRPGQQKVLINQQAMERLGYHDPQEVVGRTVINGQGEFEIIGVVRDVNYYTIKISPVPTFFTLNDREKSYIAFKYEAPDVSMPLLIKNIRSLFNTNFPDNAFDYQFLDQKIAVNLIQDKTFALVFGIFSVLAIIIGVIGILGLVVIVINQNMKEFGVRKVLGASYPDISILLSRQILWPMIIATALSLPFSALILRNRILRNYTYHISIQWAHLAVPVLILVVVFIVVVLVLGIKAYRMNITSVLKTE